MALSDPILYRVAVGATEDINESTRQLKLGFMTPYKGYPVCHCGVCVLKFAVCCVEQNWPFVKTVLHMRFVLFVLFFRFFAYLLVLCALTSVFSAQIKLGLSDLQIWT